MLRPVLDGFHLEAPQRPLTPRRGLEVVDVEPEHPPQRQIDPHHGIGAPRADGEHGPCGEVGHLDLGETPPSRPNPASGRSPGRHPARTLQRLRRAQLRAVSTLEHTLELGLTGLVRGWRPTR
ncbi:MAG: hypothetical protein AAF211_25370 [Myxococcota bacterium]